MADDKITKLQSYILCHQWLHSHISPLVRKAIGKSFRIRGQTFLCDHVHFADIINQVIQLIDHIDEMMV